MPDDFASTMQELSTAATLAQLHPGHIVGDGPLALRRSHRQQRPYVRQLHLCSFSLALRIWHDRPL